MNIIHMKYAVEVARLGSINKASESLGMAQPNISRAIKDLEADLGITIFDRSSKGMNLTPEGKEFISRTENILSQINELEYMFRGGIPAKKKFSVSAPRAGYIAEAFAKFSRIVDGGAAEVVLDETGTYNTIKKVVSSECKLGIIRYDKAADSYFSELLDESDLVYESIAEFRYTVITSEKSDIAKDEVLTEEKLQSLMQITHVDRYEATLSASDSKDDIHFGSDRCVFVLDSAAQLELLSENTEAYMWVSPAPQTLLDRYGLIQLECDDNKKVYKDVLIYRRSHNLTELDKAFICELKNAAERTFYK